MVDVTCAQLPRAGERLHGRVTLHAGGSAVNAAVAASTAGASATVIGRIGADAAGDLVVGQLESRGVESALARDPDFPTGTAVAFAEDERRTVVADRGANARLEPDDIPSSIAADVLFVSGFALFQAGSAAAAAAAIERFSGSLLGIDVASPRLAAGARELSAPSREFSSAIFATAEEAHAITGAGAEDAARLLADRFGIGCVKLGRDGAIAVRGHETQQRRAAPVFRETPFGAGDAFAGTLLVALAANESLGDALERACNAGARAAKSCAAK